MLEHDYALNHTQKALYCKYHPSEAVVTLLESLHLCRDTKHERTMWILKEDLSHEGKQPK